MIFFIFIKMNVYEQFLLFKARAEELRNTRLIRESFNPGITISWNRMQGLRFKSREPNEESLRSFLLTFRQFILNDEPVFLYKVYNLCQKHLMSDKLKDYLSKSREIWKQEHKSAGIKLVYNEREFTPEYITDLWINGYYFHSDTNKLCILNKLLPHERMLVKNQFLNFLLDATRQVLYVANIIKVALKEGYFRFSTNEF
jgi:hypothetical protein